ncbi:hypothetical protein K439DRAFT_1139635 [Ramaria rubella]|nr:hypothetical protein K439DRAFT_1139635 [Ramaria rubella]
MIAAAREATAYAMNHQVSIKHLHFFADNTSAIQNIFKAAPTAGQQRSERFRIRGNERADKLAKAATQLRGPEWATGTHALRLAKAMAIDNSKRDWKWVPPSRQYAPADCSPPSMKPPPHFFSLDRHTYGLIIQAQTGHAFMGEYYATNVLSNETSCPCGAALQTRAHILCDCSRYDEYRHILDEAVPSGHIFDIIGTPNGITALASLITVSGTFTKMGNPHKDAVIEQSLDAACEAPDLGDPE